MTEQAEDEEPEEDDDGEGDDEEGDDAADEGGEDDGGDMQLAWEMLEVARTIYSHSADKHKPQLAGRLKTDCSTMTRGYKCELYHLQPLCSFA